MTAKELRPVVAFGETPQNAVAIGEARLKFDLEINF